MTFHNKFTKKGFINTHFKQKNKHALKLFQI